VIFIVSKYCHAGDDFFLCSPFEQTRIFIRLFLFKSADVDVCCRLLTTRTLRRQFEMIACWTFYFCEINKT
jgi:hypothetical protein